MTTWVKVLIGVVGGFAGGFATGFFFHKRLNDVEFEEISQEEMALIEEGLAKKEGNETGKQNTIESMNPLPTDPDQIRNTLQGKVSYVDADNAAKEKYSKIWDTVKGYSTKDNADQMPVQREDYDEPPVDLEEGFDDEFMEVIEEETVEPGQVMPPHPIDLVAFYNDRPEYDKITIEWYEEDDTFVDEKEEIVADINAYVGNIDLKKLFSKNEPDEDPDIRFVRNEQYGSDYEIIRHHRSFTETTGGSE